MTGALAAVNQSEVAPAKVQASSEPRVEINCLETQVEEGEDFRLIVIEKFDSEGPYKRVSAFWYTNPITADESDYERCTPKGRPAKATSPSTA